MAIRSEYIESVKNKPTVNYLQYLDSLPDNEREKAVARAREIGVLAPVDEGLFVEAGQGLLQSANQMIQGLGKTAEKAGLGSGLKDWAGENLAANQQWNAPEKIGVAGYIGRAIGEAAGTTAVIAPVGLADALFGTKGAITFSTLMASSIGENIDRNRQAYGEGNEGKVIGLAAAESFVDAGIETLLGTVPMLGKALKRLPYIAKRGIVEGVVKTAEKQLGKKAAHKFFISMAKNGLEEGAEEGLQYLNSWFWQTVGNDPNVRFSLEEMGESVLKGAIGGTALGVAGGISDARSTSTSANTNAAAETQGQDLTGELIDDVAEPLENDIETTAPSATADTAQTILPETAGNIDIEQQSRMVNTLADVFGVKVNYFDETGIAPMETEAGRQDGFFDPETGEIYLDRNSETNLNFLFGHEFKHYIDTNFADLAKTFDDLIKQNINQEGQTELAEQQGNFEEFSADAFGRMIMDNNILQQTAARLEQQQQGLGERLLNAVQEFIKTIKRKLKHIGTPDAKVLFDNMNQLQSATVDILAEIKKRQTETAQTENVQTEQTVTPVVTENNGELQTGQDINGQVQTETANTAQEVVDRPEVGETFEKFFERMEPKLRAAVAQQQKKHPGHGNYLEDELYFAGMDALTKAYMNFDPAQGNKISAVTTKYVQNAFNQVLRKEMQKNTDKGTKNLSLDQTNEQGDALADAVADPNQQGDFDDVSFSEMPAEFRKRVKQYLNTLGVQDRRMLELSLDGMSPSLIARAQGVMEKDAAKVSARIQKLRRDMIEGMGLKAHETKTEPEGEIRSSGSLRNLMGVRYAAANDDSIAPEIRQAFPKYSSNQAKEVLKSIAGKDLKNIDTGIEAQINTNQYNKLVSNTAAQKSENNGFSREEHFEALANIEELFQNAVLLEKTDDLKNNDPNVKIYRFASPFVVDNEIADALLTVKESIDSDSKKIYSLELTEIKMLSEKGGTLKYHTDSINKLQQKHEKVKQFIEKNQEKYHITRKRNQINPIIQDGRVRRNHADLLENKEYTPETIEQWDKSAVDWIMKQGGVVPAIENILDNNRHKDRHVNTLIIRHLLESDVVKALDFDTLTELQEAYIEDGTAWGREGVARRLASLTLDSIERVQALFNKMHEKIGDQEFTKLRNKIFENLGVDIAALDQSIVEDKSKLDAVLREFQTQKAGVLDKAYEFWINAILSAPSTHGVNIAGNTANTVYEFTAKRLVEAGINLFAKRKDAATFGEFKEMWKHIDWKSVMDRAKKAFDQELLSPQGKFREHSDLAIGGKTGRIIRIPGRALRFMDEMAKGIIIPVETAAQAYRSGTAQGLKGDALQNYIKEKINDTASAEYRKGVEKGQELTFQSDPGKVVQYLIGLKNEGGITGNILRYILPFITTPSNILKQGVRKSPAGAIQFGIETVQTLAGKRKIDSEYLGHAAEQFIAWGTLMMLAGMDDDDDLPFITGSSDKYGSAEQRYKEQNIPPYSIRIGDTYVSYRRVETFATMLSATADLLEYWRMKDKVGSGKAFQKTFNKMARSIAEKSYLEAIDEIIQWTENPEKSAQSLGTNFIASWMPNAAKSFIMSAEDEVRNNKSYKKGADLWKDQFHIVTSKAGLTSRLPKVDCFGEVITKENAKDANPSTLYIGRLLGQYVKKIDETDKVKRLILNYNYKSNPEEPYWPDIPRNTFRHENEKYYFGNKDYHDFCIESGKLAKKQLDNAVRHGLLNVDNPTEEDIKLIRKVFARARKEVKEQFIRKGKYNKQ